MQYIFALFVVSISFFSHANSQNWDGFTESYIKHLKKSLNKKAIPGAALSIVKPNSPSIALGIGVTKLKNGQPITENTRFRLASISKTFAGSLASKVGSSRCFFT